MRNAAAHVLIALSVSLISARQVQDSDSPSALWQALSDALGFEAAPNGNMPGGWGGGASSTIFVDELIVHSGKRSVRIERRPDSENTFSTVAKSIPIVFSGSTIELRGFLKTEDVSDFAGLWMREDGDLPTLAIDNMQGRQLKGTTPWTAYSITLPVHPQAKKLFFGVLLSGTGKAWADDLQLLVDSKPVWEAPKADRPKTVLDTDREFDSGSSISLNELTGIQIDNLVILGKVWGFLKYYHPAVTSGRRQWDYDLLRVLPDVLKAPDHANANAAIAQWIEELGPVSPCNPCGKPDTTNLEFGADLDWIANAAALGPDLSRALVSIRGNHFSDKEFYASLVPGIGNPSFDHELSYSSIKFPDSGFQLLALFRFWNIVEYWSPYRNILGEDWTHVLAEFIPRIATANSLENYKRELLALVARAHDGHANLWPSLDIRPPSGKCELPVDIRFIGKFPVVSGLLSNDPNLVGELKVGDEIVKLDRIPIGTLIENWLPYYSGSNNVTRFRDIARSMPRGECGATQIAVRRGNQELQLDVKRVPPIKLDTRRYVHDLQGPTFRLLSRDIAYLKLSSVKIADCKHYIEQAAGTKGLIIDIRNYPSEFVVFALGSLLVDHETPFVRFTKADLSNPGAFHWMEPLTITVESPHYAGRIVVLADETSISQAEYTTMAFRAAHGAIVVGSTTSGADGNVAPFSLPGGLRTMISGLGVFYPDKNPTQRIGIVPDIDVRPTITGIRDGRDEVLEGAIRQILGQRIPESDIQKLAKPD